MTKALFLINKTLIVHRLSSIHLVICSWARQVEKIFLSHTCYYYLSLETYLANYFQFLQKMWQSIILHLKIKLLKFLISSLYLA